MDGPAVAIEYLEKTYRGGVTALAGISLDVPRGCVFGLLGPNGAGKSTLVKSLLTIIRPTACRGNLLGMPIGHRPTLGKVGYLPEHARFPEYLTGQQMVEFSAGLADMPRHEARVRTQKWLERVGMKDAAQRKLGSYSKGMRQRIGLAQAMVIEPELVLLDEPTDGVDPAGRIEIRRLVQEMRDEGRTVFVNSHLLAEVEQMADRVAILAQGKVLAHGSVAEMTRSGARYQVRTLGPVPVALREAFERDRLQVAGDVVTLEGADAAAVQPVIDALRAAKVSIREVKETRQSLEELFLAAVGNSSNQHPL